MAKAYINLNPKSQPERGRRLATLRKPRSMR